MYRPIDSSLHAPKSILGACVKTFESVRVDTTAQATCVDGAWSEAGIAFRLSSATCGSFKLAPRLLSQVRCDKDPYHVRNLFRCLERSPEHGFI